MFYKRVNLLSLILCALFVPCALHARDVSNMSGIWSAGTFKTCMTDGVENTYWCLKGDKCGSAFTLKTEKYDGKDKANDEYVRLAWIAHEIHEGGAKFCPTEIRSANKEATKTSWLEYYSLGGKCYWMCREGWSGSNCRSKVSSIKMCKPESIDKQNSIGRAAAKAINIAGILPMFRLSDYRRCDKDTNQEHDMVLMAVVQDDHTMVAQAMTVRAAVRREGTGALQRVSAPFIYSSGSQPMPLCMPGYKPVKRGADVWYTRCEPINEDWCDMSSMTWCDGFSKGSYTANESRFTLDTDGECIKFKCANSDEGLSGEGASIKCVKCPTDAPLGGVHPETGRCVSCESGEWFDSQTGECVRARILTRVDLQYGAGRTKNATTNVELQCWTMMNPEDYSCCVAQVGCARDEEGQVTNVPVSLIDILKRDRNKYLVWSKMNAMSMESTSTESLDVNVLTKGTLLNNTLIGKKVEIPNALQERLNENLNTQVIDIPKVVLPNTDSKITPTLTIPADRLETLQDRLDANLKTQVVDTPKVTLPAQNDKIQQSQPIYMPQPTNTDLRGNGLGNTNTGLIGNTGGGLIKTPNSMLKSF